MNQLPNIEDFKRAIDEGVMVDEHGFIYIKKAELFRLMDKCTHQQLQKAHQDGYNAGLADVTRSPVIALGILN